MKEVNFDNEKNKNISPFNILPFSGRKYWWKCDFGHSYKASAAKRSNGRACKECSNQTSSLEIRIYTELKKIFKNVKWREKIFNKENLKVLVTTEKT